MSSKKSKTVVSVDDMVKFYRESLADMRDGAGRQIVERVGMDAREFQHLVKSGKPGDLVVVKPFTLNGIDYEPGDGVMDKALLDADNNVLWQRGFITSRHRQERAKAATFFRAHVQPKLGILEILRKSASDKNGRCRALERQLAEAQLLAEQDNEKVAALEAEIAALLAE